MTTPDEQQVAEDRRGQRISEGVARVKADWRPFLGLVIGAPSRRVLLAWVQDRYGLDEEVAEIVLDQKLSTIVELPDR